MSYSAHFADERAATRYNEEQYAPSSYSTLLWEIEKRQLDEIITYYAQCCFDYMDFACGTGRVLAHVTPRARSSVGIDVSEAMAARAREGTPGAEVLTRDITVEGSVEGHYDVITAYRFLLNAEPSLRLDGLRALRNRLRSSSSVLIMNNHGNLMSHKALMALPNWIRQRGRRRQSGNVLAGRDVVRVAKNAGLQVQRVAGCGFIGGQLASLLPRDVVERIERWITGSPLSRLSSNQLYIARLQ